MIQSCIPGRPVIFAVGLLSLVSSLFAQAPLTIDTITDRSTYNNSTSFRVPSTNGYTYSVLLDGKPVPTDIIHQVATMDYHEVFVSRVNISTLAVSNRLVRFIVLASDRGAPETGLTKWTPYPPITSTAAELAGAQMKVIAPQDYPLGLPIPIVLWISDQQGNEQRVNGLVNAPGFESTPVQVRRGVGSGFLPAAAASGTIAYNPSLQTLQANKQINIESSTAWIQRSGVLASSEVWPPNSRIQLVGSLTVPAGLSLTIGAGTIVRVNPLINITNTGRCVINGTPDQPVVFTSSSVVVPENPNGAWGGFVMRGSSAVLEANSAILAGGGGGTGWSFSPGSSHKSQQPVLFIHSGAAVRMTNCAVLNSAGQMGNGYNSDLTLDHTLWQRAITGGEYVGGTITVNHSAIMEFPNDDGFVNAAIADGDYDGIYFTEGTHVLMNSLFGFAKDDAIDSGSGGAGTVYVTNCWVESAQHEAHAWSGEGRVASSYDIVLINSGQGLECGWSSSDNSPDVVAERMLSTGNSIGTRFGDNYDWDYWGHIRVTNSLILNNYRDMWGMNWDNWQYGIHTPNGEYEMDLQSNLVTQLNPNHPNNTLWDPARDGWQLAHWMTTPPNAAVGMGFAVRTNQFLMSSIFDGVPVRLSSFTTNFVSVDYAFQDTNNTALGFGTLTFAPGETVKRIYPSGFNVAAQTVVRAVLLDGVGGEITGVSMVTFTGSVPAPQVTTWVSGSQLPSYRLPEGMFVRLTGPSGLPVSVDYAYQVNGVTLAGGTLTFAPGETVKIIDPAGVDPTAYDQIFLNLSNAVNAPLVGITSVRYDRPVLEVAFAVNTNQFATTSFSNGLPVALTLALANTVSVDFKVEASGGVLTNGTLTFAPGQTSRTLLTPTVNPTLYNLIRVSLSNPVRAQLGQATNVYFLPAAAGAQSPLLVGTNSAWRYLDTGGNAGTTWRSLGYNDTGWSNGPAQLGFGDSPVDEATMIRRVGTNGQVTITFYFRQKFVVDNPGVFTNLFMSLLRDDGGVVYLNGIEAYRSPSMPAGTISYQTLADAQGSSAPPDNFVDTTNLSPGLLVTGTNIVAVEIHQHDTGSSDVSFALALTGRPTPAAPPQPIHMGFFDGQFTLVWASSSFVLYQANDVTGPWTPVGNRSPVRLTIDPSIPQKFYRLAR